MKGRVACDDGACNALLNHGGSLLPVGIASVEGSFAAGDPVDVVDLQGRIIGRGLAGYAASELEGLLGKHGEREFINRDELVIF